MTRRWAPERVIPGFALAAWAALFWTVLLTGRTSFYLSDRTSWLVPLGAALTTVAAVGRLSTARTGEDRGRGRPWAAGLLILPVALALTSAPAALSSYAVGRRSSFAGAGIAATTQAVSGPLDFVDVAAARSNPQALRALRRRSGERIALEGFVTTQANLGSDGFLLTRFILTCCVADATIAQVRVVGLPAGSFRTDDWVRVAGRVYALGAEVLIVAESVRPIETPDGPYLTP